MQFDFQFSIHRNFHFFNHRADMPKIFEKKSFLNASNILDIVNFNYPHVSSLYGEKREREDHKVD